MSDELADYDSDLLVDIIADEIAKYVAVACSTANAGLGWFGDEPAQAKIVREMQHLHLAEPWLPAVAAAKRLRAAGLAVSS